MGTKVLRRDGMLMKCLSVLFSVILVIGLMPSGAWAAGTPLGDGSVQYTPDSVSFSIDDDGENGITLGCDKVVVNGDTATATIAATSGSANALRFAVTNTIPGSDADGTAFAEGAVDVAVPLNQDFTFYIQGGETGWVNGTGRINVTLDGAPTIIDLYPTNEELMWKNVKACIEDYPEGQDYLVVFCNSENYTYYFSGTLAEALASTDRETDPRWAASFTQTISSEYVDYDGTVVTVTDASKKGFRLPITLPEGQSSFSLPLVAASVRNGDESITARRVDVDLTAGTALFGNYEATIDVAVSSSVDDVKVASAGSCYYKGYIDNNGKVSNEWTSQLSFKLTDGTYDKLYTTPVISDQEAETAVVANDGTVTVTVKNSRILDKTQTADGKTSTVKMHVADNAPYEEAGTWVDRTFVIDTQAGTATISGTALTPKGEPVVDPVSEFAYDGEDLQFIAADGTAFGMLRPQEGTAAVVADGKVTITYVPNRTTYPTIYLGADITMPETWSEDARYTLSDGAYTIELPDSYCGKAWPVAAVKADGTSTTSTQYYLAIPAKAASTQPVIENQTFTARAGEAFSFNVAAQGEPAPTLALAEGAQLPVGVSFENGVISGTVLQTGSTTFDVVATNSQGTATATITFNVVPKYKAAAGTAYISVAVDGRFVTSNGQDSGTVVDHIAVPLSELEAIDLDAFGYGALKQDANNDGSYDVTMLQLLICAAEKYCSGGAEEGLVFNEWGYIGGFWGVSSSNMVFLVDGMMAMGEGVDEWGYPIMLNPEQTVLADGDDVSAFILSATWSQTSGDPNAANHFFVDGQGAITHTAQGVADQPITFTLNQSTYGMTNYELSAAPSYPAAWGTDYNGDPAGTATTGEDGTFQVTFEQPGTYYVWADGIKGANEAGANVIVSSPAMVTVTVGEGSLDMSDAIAEAEAALAEAVVSTDGIDVDPADKWVTQAERDALSGALGAAKFVQNNPFATYMVKKSALVTLIAATQTYKAAEKPGNKPAPADTTNLEKAVNDLYTDISSTPVASSSKDVESGTLFSDLAAHDRALAGLMQAHFAALMYQQQGTLTQQMADSITTAINSMRAQFDAAKQTGTKGDKVWTRVSGATDLANMAAIVQSGFESSEWVIVATDASFHDALAAAPLAGVRNAPILLTDKASLSPETASEISRLGATHAIIVGGEAAVSPAVAEQLAALPGMVEVQRFAGEQARLTAVAIAAEVARLSDSDTAILATAKGPQDALAAGPFAWKSASPTFLVRANGELEAPTLEGLKASGCTNVIVCGGTAVVPDSVVATLRSEGFNVTRRDGETALQTSASLANWSIDNAGMTADGMAAAGISDWRSALVGAPVCGKRNSVLVLLQAAKADTYNVNGFVKPHASEINSAYLLGTAVNDDVLAALEAASQ